MTLADALNHVRRFFDSGEFFDLLARRVAIASESQTEPGAKAAQAYLTDEMQPYLEALGFSCRLLDNPETASLPMLAAVREEAPDLPTILIYGHGDTVLGMDHQWATGRHPWTLTKEGERWYGRGAADNKGQHTINLTALETVLKKRGSLGFNAKVLIEIGEEMGSPGLRQVCAEHRDLLKADALIASDGPRLAPDRPTIFGGSRGAVNFDLRLKLRDGGHHSGNWGGLLANPGVILAHALACLVDKNGRIRVPELRPASIPGPVRQALAELDFSPTEGPTVDPTWGEPGLSLAEKVFGWSTLDVLAMACGNPEAPAHAIPPEAFARIHIRYTVDCDPAAFETGLRRHLDACGFNHVAVERVRGGEFTATRLDPDDPWARFVVASLEHTGGRNVAVLPNLGGSLPNDAFAHILGMPTVWIPHSHAACSQHAPNEFVLESITRDALALMTGLFWDLAEQGTLPGRGPILPETT
jgi:acetylornithine deacetylase/succinyl-diaminopimelate desuccinylase-like protein